MSRDHLVEQPPVEGISSLAWLGDSILVSGNWDNSVRLFQAGNAPPFSNHSILRHHKAPVLAVSAGPFSDDSVLSGSIDGDVRLSRADNFSNVLGTHLRPVRCVLYCPEMRACISGSWDCTVKLWDAQSSSGSSSREIGSATLSDKVFAMSILKGMLVVGTANRSLHYFDFRKLGDGPVMTRESPLKHQTRCIESSPHGEFLAIGCTEGRVAIEFTNTESSSKSYAFKCHRRKETEPAGAETIFPVHAISFHPTFGTFVTGGGDGQVAFWDGLGRKRLSTAGPFSNSISALSFSPDGSKLAIASSYDFSKGDERHPVDSLILRKIVETEVKPKTATPLAGGGGGGT